jgi:DNA-binding response OmpR family regulator
MTIPSSAHFSPNALQEDGFVLHAVHDGQHGLELASSGEFSLVILDVMLPRVGGMELFKELRTRSSVPVLMLTARGDEIDRIVALEGGSHDYLPKLFNPRERVVDRVRSKSANSRATRSTDRRACTGSNIRS